MYCRLRIMRLLILPILSSAFEGNFGGSVLERLKGARLDEIDAKNDARGFKGIDLLINGMLVSRRA